MIFSSSRATIELTSSVSWLYFLWIKMITKWNRVLWDELNNNFLIAFFACCIWIFCSLLFVCKCIYVSQALLQKKDLAVRISMPSLEVIVRQICWKIFSLNHFYPLLLTLFNPISFFLLFLPLYYSLSPSLISSSFYLSIYLPIYILFS